MPETLFDGAFDTPMPVLPNRVRRTYSGGMMIDTWQGKNISCDGNQPEEWLASATPAVNPGFPPIDCEGLASVVLGNKTHYLRDILNEAPKEILGARHTEQSGKELGILAKIIDSAERLSIQVHPDKLFAKEHFHSDYGKTECWHILETRVVNGQTPYLLLGFRPGVTKAYWQQLYENQDIPAMIGCLNKVVPHPGDTYFIPGGMPHAIGSGCFLIEIQEPTDLTLRSERTMQDGTPIPDELIHQGLGEDLLMECFHYECMDEKLLKERCYIPRITTYTAASGTCTLLVGKRNTPCFSMQYIECFHKLHFQTSVPTIIIAIRGDGQLIHAHSSYSLKQGEHIFLPAGVHKFSLLNRNANAPFECVRCFPPNARPDSPK